MKAYPTEKKGGKIHYLFEIHSSSRIIKCNKPRKVKLQKLAVHLNG